MKLSAHELTKSYGARTILDKVSFSVAEGHCLGIMGESGSGKSTIARLLLGLEQPSSGEICWDGLSYRSMNKKDRFRRGRSIQLVFQNAFGAVNPNFLVEEVLYEPLYIHRRNELTTSEKSALAKEMLSAVGLSHISMSQNARTLSGGQLQRLCLARALMLKPEVLILDESLSGLDPLVQRQMLRLLGDLQKQLQLTYVFIAHDFGACYYLCDEIIILDQGKVIEHLQQLDDDLHVTHPLTRRLIHPEFFNGNIKEKDHY